MVNCLYNRAGKCNNKMCIHYHVGGCTLGGTLIPDPAHGEEQLLLQLGIRKSYKEWALDNEAILVRRRA